MKYAIQLCNSQGIPLQPARYATDLCLDANILHVSWGHLEGPYKSSIKRFSSTTDASIWIAQRMIAWVNDNIRCGRRSTLTLTHADLRWRIVEVQEETVTTFTYGEEAV